MLACNGTGREAFWSALEEGRSGIDYITRFDPSDLPCKIGGQLWDFDAHDYLKKADVKRWHPSVHQAVAATKLAMEDSELLDAGYQPERVATGFGTSVGDIDAAYHEYMCIRHENGWENMPRLTSSAVSAHASTANVTAMFGFRGPAITIGSGCSTGLDTLAWGVGQLQTGNVDAAVVGATETPLFDLAMAAAAKLGILCNDYKSPTDAMRPFDKSSSGLVLSESAVVLTLERSDHAEARGARIFGEVAGNGSASEGHSAVILQREGYAIANAIQAALEDAGLEARDIDCAHCHGVSLPMYDKAETQGYRNALQEYAYRIPITASKSMIGQAYAVGGLLNVVGALLSLERGVIPPTINLENPSPECDLDYVPKTSRYNDPATALVNALSFGGTHTAAVLKRWN